MNKFQNVGTVQIFFKKVSTFFSLTKSRPVQSGLYIFSDIVKAHTEVPDKICTLSLCSNSASIRVWH